MLIDSIISKRVYVLVETIGELYSTLVKVCGVRQASSLFCFPNDHMDGNLQSLVNYITKTFDNNR